LELGGGSPVQVDFEPSIELAHGYRKADISARARSQGREALGFENPTGNMPVASRVRTVMHRGNFLAT
jgi:hypothetical protein